MVIVIWVLSLLTIMAGSFALSMRRETSVITAVKENAVTLAAAETGLQLARIKLLIADENKRWRADGSIYPLQYQGAEIRVRILSEQGKIDINKADEVLLTTMLKSTDIELDRQQQIVSAILDWRDQDDLVHINGAEKQQYEEEGLAYSPANKAFQIPDELQLVLGMDAALYQKLQPLLTVYSGLPNINMQVAAKEVLQVFSELDSTMLEAYLQQRIENNRLQIPPAVFPFSSKNIGNNAGGQNEAYTVIAEARINGEMGSVVKEIIRKAGEGQQDSPFQTLDWQQIYPKVSLFSDEMESLLVVFQDEPEQLY